MKRNLIFSFIVVCLGILASYMFSSLIDASYALCKTEVNPLPISSYVKTDFNLIAALKNFGDSKHHSTLEFSNLNLYLNYYRRTGVIRAKKDADSFVFFDDSNVPAEFRNAVNSAHVDDNGVLFVSYGKLAEQDPESWRGSIYAVSDNGVVYSIPDGEKQKFISALETKKLAYERAQNLTYYSNHISETVLLLLLAIWLVPLYRYVKSLYLKIRSIDSFEFNISFKYKN